MRIKQDNTYHKIYNAKIIGLLFLLAFLLYGFGRNLFESNVTTNKYIGALLIVLNSIVVFFIGIFLRRTLKEHNVSVANFYFFSRIIEAIALVSIVLNLIPTINLSTDYGYFLAMLVLGIGSIPMCFVLCKHNITPKWLAIWGLIGYAIFAFGFLMELFGKKWSTYLLALGGLWEIVFAIWLLVKPISIEKPHIPSKSE